METNVQEVVNSLARQISELSLKLALAEAEIATFKNSTEDQE
jgi:hypothetical protein